MSVETILAIALIVTLFLLACSLVGGSAIRDEQRNQIAFLEDDVRAKNELLEECANVLGLPPLPSVPGSDTPLYDEVAIARLRRDLDRGMPL